MINFYYSRSCPHSLSLMEILTRFQTQYDPAQIQMIDVDKESYPPEVYGTPTIFIDQRYYYGDDAFERIGTIEVQSKAREASVGGGGGGGGGCGIGGVCNDDLNSLDIIEEGPVIKKAPSPQSQSQTQTQQTHQQQSPPAPAGPDFDSMFNNDPIMPRKQ